jgi:hypothetical protein
VKGRGHHLVLERGGPGASEEVLRGYFVHPDGLMRVPVLLAGGIAVRGYHPDLYRDALAAAGLVQEAK